VDCVSAEIGSKSRPAVIAASMMAPSSASCEKRCFIYFCVLFKTVFVLEMSVVTFCTTLLDTVPVLSSLDLAW